MLTIQGNIIHNIQRILLISYEQLSQSMLLACGTFCCYVLMRICDDWWTMNWGHWLGIWTRACQFMQIVTQKATCYFYAYFFIYWTEELQYTNIPFRNNRDKTGRVQIWQLMQIKCQTMGPYIRCYRHHNILDWIYRKGISPQPALFET